jgi:hypothetical protein
MAKVLLNSRVDFLPDRLASRYTAELDYSTLLAMGERVILDRIIEDASKKLAAAFVEFHGGEILNAVKSEDVSKRVVEEVVKRMIDKLKE